MNLRDKARKITAQVAREAGYAEDWSPEEFADAVCDIYEPVLRDVIQVLAYTKMRLDSVQMPSKEVQQLFVELRAQVRNG